MAGKIDLSKFKKEAVSNKEDAKSKENQQNLAALEKMAEEENIPKLVKKKTPERKGQLNLGSTPVSVIKAIDKAFKQRNMDNRKCYIMKLLKKDGVDIPDSQLSDPRKTRWE